MIWDLSTILLSLTTLFPLLCLCFQKGAHHKDHPGMSEWGLRGGTRLWPWEACLSSEASHRDVFYCAITQTQSMTEWFPFRVLSVFFSTMFNLRGDTSIGVPIVNPVAEREAIHVKLAFTWLVSPSHNKCTWEEACVRLLSKLNPQLKACVQYVNAHRNKNLFQVFKHCIAYVL